MIELIRTNDSVLLSFAEALMKEAGIAYFIADTNMSIIEGSLGVLPRRLLVSEDQLDEARQILIDAEIEHELRDQSHEVPPGRRRRRPRGAGCR